MKSVGRAASSVDAFIFATGTDAGAVKVWDLTDYACISSSSWPKSGSVLGLSMANAETILSCWEDGSVKCTDSLGKLLWHIPTAHRDGATSIATYLDNERQFFVTGGGDGAVRVWKYSNRELVSQYTEHRKGVARVLIDEVSPNIVHSVGKDCSVLSYDLKAARRIICHIVNNGTMFNMTQRKDHENELVTCDSMGRLLFWDIDLREPVMVVQDPSSLPIRNCEISPSGRFLVFVCDDLLVKVLDVNTSAVISLGQGHTDKILSVAWSPDERQVVTVGADMCMCVWNFYLGGAN